MSTATSPATSPATRRKIVLVEDNPADVFLFKESLRNHGIEFDLVHHDNGEDALRYLRRGDRPLDPREGARPDVIVLDLHLPGIDGNEILREIVDEPWLQGVPIAILSGAPPERLGALDLAGSSAYIHKSMDVREYIEKVGRTILELCERGESPAARSATRKPPSPSTR